MVVRASSGVAPAPGGLVRALAAGCVPVVARVPVYEELVGDGEHGLLFEPGDADTLAAQLARLVADAALRARLRDGRRPAAGAARAGRAWSTSWRRSTPASSPSATTAAATARCARRSRKRRRIDVDLHMHTDHSYDCATPVEVLLATAKARGLGAIAVTDHNEISGALEAQAKASGIKVIVGEEVKTADQGEVIGLFLSELIPRGLTLQETIAEIKRQGGVVYVPHPFDRMHAVPDYEHLMAVLDDVDAIEVFNPRVAIQEFNEEAARFAAKYRIPAGAGSDAHVAQGLGSVRIRMPDFDGPEEFMEALREADIVRTPASLLYVQALKFLQTRAVPRGGAARPRASGGSGGRRASPDAGAGTCGGRVQSSPKHAHHRRRDPREVPRAGDPRAEPLHARAAGVQTLPARQPDAGAGLRPSAGRRLADQAPPAARRRSRRASPSTGAPAAR